MRHPVFAHTRPHARSRRALAAATALAAVTGAAVPLLGVAQAVAAEAPLPAFSSAQAVFSDTSAQSQVIDTVIAADGSTVALVETDPYGRLDHASTLYVLTRPAGSEAWGKPVKLAGPLDSWQLGAVPLTVTGDKVVAVWGEYPDAGPAGIGPGRLVSAVLTAGTWSAPAPFLETTAGIRPGGPRLAAGPQGTVVAAWRARTAGTTVEGGIQTAILGTDGRWSEPSFIVSDAEGAQELSGHDLTVDGQGNATVVYAQENALLFTSRTAGSQDWSTPAALDTGALGPDEYGPYAPQISAAANGALTVIWESKLVDPKLARTSVHAATRAAGAAAWSAPARLAGPGGVGRVYKPVVQPDGDVTVIWNRGMAEREADTGRWSAPRDVFPNGQPLDVALGPDGTARVMGRVWKDQKTYLAERARPAGGTWSAPTKLVGSGMAGSGEIAAGPKGEGAAVWTGPDGNYSFFAARTLTPLPAPKVLSASIPTTGKVPRNGLTYAWAPRWVMDRFTSSWTVTVTDPKTGKTVWTQEPYYPQETDVIKVTWSGRLSNGSLAPSGPLNWTLKATTPGHTTPLTLGSGTFTLSDGGRVVRDFGSRAGAPDNTGDVFSVTSTGGIRIAYGNAATGNFSGSTTGTGWPAGTLPTPMGDMDGDRCNDVLVRMPTGEMRRYTPGCKAAALTPATAHKVLGKGWNAYDVITSPGDLNRDGTPDLIARDAATGTLYRYNTIAPGTATYGLLSGRVSLGTGFKGYKKIVGIGDANGDGNGDLLLQDASNELWRMDGTGKGTFAPRVLVAKDWGASYNTVVGVGDLNGDHRVDLLARDTAGAVHRLNGTGKGTFGTPARLGTGWQVYKSLR
ncbi:FG-GAP repeat domain-containing protein [Streptomyces sp. NBC_00239]|uniref:FG-GAP repeat domain-containing protein n=1 Tax=Streptomyces sp. NBC_00239 TaxID=2903640 RepID=UPI002E2E3707|nr:VCBS repeat-containing protein [Streptomyces sp. NBC_00239]